MNLDEAIALAKGVDAFDPEVAAEHCDLNNEPPICIACNGEYRMVEPGLDPTATCDACAHQELARLARAVLAMAPVITAAVAYVDASRVVGVGSAEKFIALHHAVFDFSALSTLSSKVPHGE